MFIFPEGGRDVAVFPVELIKLHRRVFQSTRSNLQSKAVRHLWKVSGFTKSHTDAAEQAGCSGPPRGPLMCV